MNVYSPPSCPELWQAGVLECLITALRLNRNDPETLRWAAGALGSICSEDVGQLRERAVKVAIAGGMAQRNADWQNHISAISVDILKKGLNCFKVYDHLGCIMQHRERGARYGVVSFRQGRWDRNSMLSAHQESWRSTSPGAILEKSWRFAGGVLRKRENGLTKKRPEVFQKNTFTLMKAGYGLMKLSFWIQKKGMWWLGARCWASSEYFLFMAFGRGKRLFYLKSSPDIRMWFSWRTKFLWPSISGWLSSMGIDMFDNSCQSSYLLTGKHFERIKRHATGVFQHTKTASNDGQVFLDVCTAHLLLLSLSFPFAPLHVSWTKRSMSAMPFGRSAKGMSPSPGVSGLWRQWWHFPPWRCWVFLRVGC